MACVRALLAVPLVAAAALVAAGCGGGGSAGGAGAVRVAATAPETASLAPKDAGAWVEVDVDRSSAQWRQLEAFLARLPGGRKALDEALSQVGGSMLDLERDVQPAIGDTLVLVVPRGAERPVALVRPEDEGKLAALLAQTKEPEATAQVRGWTAIGRTRAALDAYTAALASGTLADSPRFSALVGDLPDEALARGWVDSAGLSALVGSAAGSVAGARGRGAIPGIAPGDVGSAAFAVSATDGALRLEGSAETTRGVTTYAPTLLRRLPSDALLAISFHGGKQLASQPGSAAGAGAANALERQLGVPLADLAAALDGECVLYARAGAPIPEITLAVKPSDPARAEATLSALVAKLSASGSSGSALPLPLPALHVERRGDLVVVSTAEGAAAQLASGGAKLVDTKRFQQAAADAGLGDETAGFVYVDVRSLGPLVKTALGALGGSSGSSSRSTDDAFGALAALDTVAFGAAVDGARVRFAGAVRAG